MKIMKQLQNSMNELKSVKALTATAMLMATAIVLGIIGNVSLAFFPSVKISFTIIPIALIAILFGPAVSGIVAMSTDIICYFLLPQNGMFFPGWTLSALLRGLIYGFILYKNKNTAPRILIAQLISTIFVELILGTLWLKIQFGMPYITTFIPRIVKQLLCSPFEIILILVISKVIVTYYQKSNVSYK